MPMWYFARASRAYIYMLHARAQLAMAAAVRARSEPFLQTVRVKDKMPNSTSHSRYLGELTKWRGRGSAEKHSTQHSSAYRCAILSYALSNGRMYTVPLVPPPPPQRAIPKQK
eukprot:scaffold87655_cov35-Tisochrysis_lutea.AAC.3